MARSQEETQEHLDLDIVDDRLTTEGYLMPR